MAQDIRFGAGRAFNERARSPAQVACDDCLSYANGYWSDLVEKMLPRQEILHRVKEVTDYLEAAWRGPGKLGREDEGALRDVEAFLAVIRLRHGIVQEELDAAVLPFRTSTGRMTATPVFPRRFDA